MLSAKKYRELFKLRAEGKLEDMECTKSLYNMLHSIYFFGMEILDVPCGVGHYFRKIDELGFLRYTGVDADSKAIAMARKIWKNKHNTAFFTQDAAKMTFNHNQFDVVLCYNLLLHLKDYKEVVKELFRVSRKYIIIRSLFGSKNSVNKYTAPKDYKNVYKKGVFYYNTYNRDEVAKYIQNLGKCDIKFIPDNKKISEAVLARQSKAIAAKQCEFTNGEHNWKGLKLNYEILLIRKR